MAMTFDEQVRSMIESHEGRIRHLYWDMAGAVVTLGVGHAVWSRALAQGLRLRFPDAIARPDDIANEYIRVKRIPILPNSPLAQLTMLDADIDDLLAGDLLITKRRLLMELPDFESLPDPWRLALTDMGFNLGSLVHYPKLVAAVERRDASAAALECYREKIGYERNAATAALFSPLPRAA